MANDYDATAKNLMLDALGLLALRVRLHTGDPGGANLALNEVVGGGYAPGIVAWAAASGGSMDETLSPVISIPAGTTVSWVSYWNVALTVRYLKKDITDETWVNAGTLTMSDADLDLNDA